MSRGIGWMVCAGLIARDTECRCARKVIRRVGLGTACLLILVAHSRAADRVEYNRTVRPILAENCFACHGPDSAARKADLRLDKRDDALKADAIVPGDLEASEMIRRILSDDPKEVMPPPMTKKTLTKAQKDLLQRWVKEGAE